MPAYSWTISYHFSLRFLSPSVPIFIWMSLTRDPRSRHYPSVAGAMPVRARQGRFLWSAGTGSGAKVALWTVLVFSISPNSCIGSAVHEHRSLDTRFQGLGAGGCWCRAQDALATASTVRVPRNQERTPKKLLCSARPKHRETSRNAVTVCYAHEEARCAAAPARRLSLPAPARRPPLALCGHLWKLVEAR